MSKPLKHAWSAAYYGVQHYGPQGYSTRNYWSTVQDHGSFARLLLWFPGCGFSPREETYSNAGEARKKGSAWVNSQLEEKAK